MANWRPPRGNLWRVFQGETLALAAACIAVGLIVGVFAGVAWGVAAALAAWSIWSALATRAFAAWTRLPLRQPRLRSSFWQQVAERLHGALHNSRNRTTRLVS